ncbi:polysaccharide deacetylase family protein [Thermaerobacter sp. FW80]|uniref:polysaccharide deacetylase family protein n=1 Tax=Thermaerobacter sp. FW80 TaxID=2546351 RepID=UPI00143004C8|nr:polysaccharide deacetylase family protein [Thermaerobacter sp. FW80]
MITRRSAPSSPGAAQPPRARASRAGAASGTASDPREPAPSAANRPTVARRAGAPRPGGPRRTEPWIPVVVALLIAATAGWGAGQLWREVAATPQAVTALAAGRGTEARDAHAPAPSAAAGRRPDAVLAAQPTVHVVQRGETLYRIARRYGVSVQELARLNGLDDPARIRAGQRLRIPAGAPGAGGDPADGGAGSSGSGADGAGGGPITNPQATAGDRIEAGASGRGAASGGAGDAARRRGAADRAGGGIVAVTFNDGPDPATWPALLDALDTAGAKATFFLEGAKMQQHPQLVQELARRGHQVENHGWSHRSPQELGAAATRAEIRRTAALIARLTGRRSLYYRPPGALREADVFRWAHAEDHQVLLWTNIGAQDVPPQPPDQLAARVAASAYNGAILMLHATQPGTVQALPELLQRLAARGLRPVTVDELLAALEASAAPARRAAQGAAGGSAGAGGT